MAKKFAIFVALLMLALVVWGLFFEQHSATILINGQEVGGPLKEVIGAGGMVVALITLISLAILMALAFAGTGIIIFGCLVVGGVIFAVLLFPFMLPLLIPLVLVWAFIALFKQKK
jgi:hypothetical protein